MNSAKLKGFWYDTLDSTMDEAKRLIKTSKIKDTAFVVAHHQTSGRGTHGRKWSSPEGKGIYLSVIHLPQESKYFPATSLYTYSAGIACVEAIKEITGTQTFIKPENDIYIQGKKLGGVLIETELTSGGITKLITGVGINTRKVFREIEQSTITPISIEEILSPEIFLQFSSKALTEAFINKICLWHTKVFNNEYREVKETWEHYKLSE